MFYESLTDKKKIVEAIAGLEDESIGNELDDYLQRLSELEAFEIENFTPSSGMLTVLRIKRDVQTIDTRTA